jgi:hypothetical protein
MIDLDTPPGAKIRCIIYSPNVARLVFEGNFDKGAIVDEVYTVERVEASSSFSSVYLVEIPGAAFNTLGFENE